MYSEWSSLTLEGGGRGVLGAVGGRDVVLAVVKQLASHEPSPLTTDAEVTCTTISELTSGMNQDINVVSK